MRHYLSIFQQAVRNRWDKPALSDYRGETFTFADMATQIAKHHVLFEKVGLKPGDKVALASKNCARWAISFLAVGTYRAVAVPILPDFAPETIGELANHSESVILFTEARIWEAIDKNNTTTLKAVISVDDFSVLYAADETLAESVAAEQAKMPKVYPAEQKEQVSDYKIGDIDDLAIINYTSGTTSSPKGVMLTAKNISSNIEFALNRIPVTETDKIMSMLPLAHMYGMAFEFIYPLCGGGHVYFLGKTPTPTVLMQALADIKPYILITVPLVMEKIFKNKVMPKLSSPLMRVLTNIPILRGVIYGKVRLPYTVGYGMTECAPLIGYSPWESFKLGSCGRAVDNVEVRIDSDDPAKKVGEIQVKGDNVMQGYYKNTEATAATFTADGYLRTGDLGIIDKEGNIFIKGRSKCMILSPNGQNIYPEEIESILNSMPHVGESLIVDRKGGLVALVALQADEKCSAEELKEIMEQNRSELNTRMPAYSKITAIEIIEGGFEHTPKQSIKRFLYN